MQVKKLVISSALALVLLPGSAYAQSWFFTPFVGANFGGNANLGDIDDAGDEFEQRVDFGATLGYQPNVVGFEVDFGWSPNFFANTVGDQDVDFGDSNVTTLMANLRVGAPHGIGIRPYGSGGVGLVRARVDDPAGLFDSLHTNDFGLNIGAGLNGQFTNNIGIRGDVRYFRSLQDNEPEGDFDLGLSNFDFWRGTVGLTFLW
jgi:opacity protein-like surface antigen